MDRLPDGGPVRVQVEGRGLDIGRDQHLDWTLPDPSRHISSKHCEIRFRDGGYWLHDVSTNGTFLNGAQFRLDAPHLLRGGDRLSIGQYIIAVEIEGRGASAPASIPTAGVQAVQAAPADIWGPEADAAAPADRRDFMPARARKSMPDFLDFATDLAPAEFPPLGAAPPAEMGAPPFGADEDWLSGPIAPPPTAEPAEPVAPTPRRPPARPAPAPAAPGPILDAAKPAAAPALPGEAAAGPSDILLRIARAAGVPERAIAGRDPNALADDIGAMLRLTAQNLAQMLSSRSETKALMRTSSRTMVQAFDNNPLKFTASPEEALAIMLGAPTRNYLDGRKTLEASFADLKAHQMQTFGAIQGSLEALFEDLAPERIAASVEADRGLGALVQSRKAKLWDTYVERWRAKTKRSDGRLSEAFMNLLAESYDRLQRKGS